MAFTIRYRSGGQSARFRPTYNRGSLFAPYYSTLPPQQLYIPFFTCLVVGVRSCVQQTHYCFDEESMSIVLFLGYRILVSFRW
jgi:hypothetical protein